MLFAHFNSLDMQKTRRKLHRQIKNQTHASYMTFTFIQTPHTRPIFIELRQAFKYYMTRPFLTIAITYTFKQFAIYLSICILDDDNQTKYGKHEPLDDLTERRIVNCII